MVTLYKRQFSRIFLKLLLLVIFTSSAHSDNTCTTPNGASGHCVPYNQCNYIKKLLAQHGLNLPPHESEYLKNARCSGASEDVIYLCCEVSKIIRFYSGENYESSLNATGVQILNSTANCGPTQIPLVANGEDAIPGEYPWMALLRYDTPDLPFKCGGTLITKRYVLTAAHCITNRLIGARLGEHDINTDIDCITLGRKKVCLPPVEDFGIEKIIAHPQFTKSPPINDVALLKLDRDVVFGRYISPICLPIIEEALKFEDDPRYFIAGWGYTETGHLSSILQKSTIPHQDRSVCQEVFKRHRITEVHICAGGENNVDTCKGDSGGPLFRLASYIPIGAGYFPRTVQFGIVSFGTIGCGNNKPAIYANVAELMPWITSNLD